jgi:glutamine cyclotransferase
MTSPEQRASFAVTIGVCGALLAALAAASTTPRPVLPEQLRVQVVASYPHNPGAFTQGLLLHDGRLYESTGLYGRSSLREVELESGRVLRRFDLPADLFGEGLALVGNRLIQLTWKERRALAFDLPTFSRVGEHAYDTEGWGLCFDGTDLIMSDGSHRLYFRDPETFAVRRQIAVTEAGEPLGGLNELECVGDAVYANVWPTARIVKIRKRNGHVAAVVDGRPLLDAAGVAARGGEAILNGIAYDPLSETFLVTGKLWPKLFRVKFMRQTKPEGRR